MTKTIRISDELHRKLKIEAATNGKGIEQYVEERLS